MTDVEDRARIHAALGDPRRLAIVEALAFGDLGSAELGERVGVASNLLAHHLRVLEGVGIIRRIPSAGDRRRRYVRLVRERLESLALPEAPPVRRVLFVCTHNSARSQLAAALWRRRGGEGESAGTEPAARVHPLAIEVARRHGLDLTAARPRGYDEIDFVADLVVSVCDRAREAGLSAGVPHLHWSVPDPVPRGTLEAFEEAFGLIAERIGLLSGEAA